MYRREETINIIREFYKFEKNEKNENEFIKDVCNYFDVVKNDDLKEQDYKFLKFLSSRIGIPHYYDLLTNSSANKIDDIDLITFASMFSDSFLQIEDNVKLHKFQYEVLEKWNNDSENRFLLTAPTAFGKTYIVYEIIKKKKYKNICLIFPTLALLSENLEKILTEEYYKEIKDTYKIYTITTEDIDSNNNNLFVFTAERFLSLIDKNVNYNFDFVFVDEIYKIDNNYIIDNIFKENERDTTYRIALSEIVVRATDILLAGPYLILKNGTFSTFLSSNKFSVLNYNSYELVNKKEYNITQKKEDLIDSIKINYCDNFNKTTKMKNILEKLFENNENIICYNSRRSDCELNAKRLISSNSNFLKDVNSDFEKFLKHVEKNFTKDWIILKALKHGIGIHHGLVPKYIQKEIIGFFNKGIINVIMSTTTITEGVNTTAKNILILSQKKGTKELKKFDAQNIMGRAGRFTKHFSGRVIILQNKFMDIVNEENLPFNHKNYDSESKKDEVDYFITENKYLSDNDIKLKQDILDQQSLKNLSESIMNSFKNIKRTKKIKLYDIITSLSIEDNYKIKKLIGTINYSHNICFEEFQFLLDLLLPIIEEKDLIEIIEFKCGENQKISALTYKLYYYFKDGLNGLIKYDLDHDKNINDSVRTNTNFVFNILRYKLVKYLGIFDLIYRYDKSIKDNVDIQEVSGFNLLLQLLEYNALTSNGKIVSDYGVPYNVLKYIDGENSETNILDEYEKDILSKVRKLIQKTE